MVGGSDTHRGATRPEQLSKLVKGQPHAIAAVASRLRSAVCRLSVEQLKPRTSFILAGSGPGPDKRVLARAISKVVYGHKKLLHFDCRDLRHDHAVRRIFGFPTGHMLNGLGGELTEGIRKNPNSLVLMEEIEKAAPRLLDALNGVLSGAPAAEGSELTVDFSSSMFVFTSELGMFEELYTETGRVHSRPRFSYDTPFEEIRASVRESVKDAFCNRLGRPELLGTLGGMNNIIVLVVLRDHYGTTRRLFAELQARCASNWNTTLQVDEDVIEHIANNSCKNPQSLVTGRAWTAEEPGTPGGPAYG